MIQKIKAWDQRSTCGMPLKTSRWKCLETSTKKKRLKERLTDNFTPIKFKEQLAQKHRDGLDEECGKFCTRINCMYRTCVSHLDKQTKPFLLTPWCRVLLEKLTSLQLVKKFPAFYGNRRFITALTSVRLLSLSWASPVQSIYPHPTSWRSILILSTHLCLGLPSGLFPSSFPTKTLYTHLSSPICATCPAHLILLDPS